MKSSNNYVHVIINTIYEDLTTSEDIVRKLLFKNWVKRNLKATHNQSQGIIECCSTKSGVAATKFEVTKVI